LIGNVSSKQKYSVLLKQPTEMHQQFRVLKSLACRLKVWLP